MQRSSQPGYTPSRNDSWFRQPVFWIAALILLASLLGCVVTIVLALRDADAPVATSGGQVMKVPLERRQ
jgi:hypothetical protein